MGNVAFFSAANPWAPGASYAAGSGASADVAAGNLGQIGVTASTPVTSSQHPFFWFAVFAAATAALIGGSTSIRVGRERAKVSLGPKEAE